MSVLSSPLFKQQCYINGQWMDAQSGETIDVTNPATGERIGTIPKMGAAETAEAIEAARIAQKAWAAMTAKERHGILIKWFNLMMDNQDALGELLTLEQGKPLGERRKAKSPMAPASSSGLQKRASAPMAKSFPATSATSGFRLFASPLA